MHSLGGNMLSVAGLRVRYGAIEALHGIDLTVRECEILALVGANGAGKSTTLAAISGLVPPVAGRIELGGEAVTGWPPEKLSRYGLSLVPEGRRIFATLTVEENLTLGGAAHVGRTAATKRAELLELFPVLRERLRRRAGDLSGGEQQMLAVARSLMSAPKLLLLDEPSLGLAPQMIDKIFEIIVRLRQSGVAILLVEQNVARALEIADRATVLQNGVVALTGSPMDLVASSLMRQAYLGG
jgi:branched-chain amino acid transport system ATP-binding protein